MKKIIITLFFIISVSAGVSNANYKDMIEDYDSYQPPSYYDSQIKTKQLFKPELSHGSFKEDLQLVDEIKSRWVFSVETTIDESPFLKINEKLMLQLKSVAIDDDATHKEISNSISLDALETLVFLRNPAIKAAEKQFIASTEQFSQVANLDEILRQYSAFTEGVKTGIGPMKGRDPIELKFPYPGVMSIKTQIVNKSVEIAKEDLEITRREVITETRKAYWNLQYVHRAYSIMDETLSLLTHLEGVATSRYETGKTSYQDVVKIRINKETLTEDLYSLKQRQRNVEFKIIELLNLSPNLKIGRPKVQSFTKDAPKLDKLFQLANQRRQELRILRANIVKMESMVTLGETMITPRYTLNLSIFKDEAINQVGTSRVKEPFAVSTTSDTGAGLPKSPWYGTNDAYLRETRIRISALKEKLTMAEAKTNTIVREAWYELDRAIREESLYATTVVELSQTSLEVSTRAYESGKIAFADVITSYDSWLKANLALQKKRSNIGISNAELKRRVGTNAIQL